MRVPLWSIFLSGNSPRDAGSSGRGKCLQGTGQIGSGHCGVCCFAIFGVIERLGASGRFLVVFRDRLEGLPRPTPGCGSSGLDFLEVIWRDLRWRRAMWGRGFDFGGGVVVGRLGARKGAYKTYYIRGRSQLQKLGMLPSKVVS